MKAPGLEESVASPGMSWREAEGFFETQCGFVEPPLLQQQAAEDVERIGIARLQFCGAVDVPGGLDDIAGDDAGEAGF